MLLSRWVVCRMLFRPHVEPSDFHDPLNLSMGFYRPVKWL